jgi:hypothetical protein
MTTHSPNLIRVQCPRCDGTGYFSFNLVKGTVCFKCEGARYLLVDEKKYMKAEAKRAARASATLAESKVLQAAAAKRYEAWQKMYRDDARLGPAIRERMAEFQRLSMRSCPLLHLSTLAVTCTHQCLNAWRRTRRYR